MCLVHKCWHFDVFDIHIYDLWKASINYKVDFLALNSEIQKVVKFRDIVVTYSITNYKCISKCSESCRVFFYFIKLKRW